MFGVLAQLGAHNTGSVGVTGSNPVCSTRIRSVELGFIRNMFALAIEIEVNR